MADLDRSDLDAWEVADLPDDFEDRVMARLLADEGAPADEPSPAAEAVVVALSPRRAARGRVVVAALAVAAAALLTWGVASRTPSGAGTVEVSDTLATVQLGPGVTANVSPGGTLRWDTDGGLRVHQDQGQVHYRVTPGTAVAVHTPAGTVEVTGTAFSVEVITMSDRPSHRSRILLASAAAATVIALVVVNEGSVDASNEHGQLSVSAGQRAVMSDAEAPRSVPEDDAVPQVAQVVMPEPPAAKRRHASPEQRRAHAQTREKIEQALARRKASEPAPEPAPSSDDAPPRPDLRTRIEGNLDKDYIRDAIRKDLIPLAHECYNDVLVIDPKFGGKLVLEFDIMGDEEVGGIVDDVKPGEGTDVAHPEFIECMSESMMTVTMPPPEGGGIVHVSYPLLFEPE